ncbi:GNAT family N-acetyltransferase [Clostridium sp. D2Q-11]|uniref:GNAT family N-acetyltransferase n=1 Tax=Anaeromonas frigoriresistens TaxID=2683708 RepID=A0A942UT71_9FIRM|nr:GNAT family N-acetyltransferase [Anaeromonas frigoriresistens]MBS4536965.1 GNAT family N-acetyltransferase [Anaeromonas frigoriresistens]
MSVYTKKRVSINKLRLEAVYEMRNWGRHESMLFRDYNFPNMTDKEIQQWYKYKARARNKKCYGIRNEEGKLIGYLTIREIKKVRKLATLGLVLDPNYMNKGYGTEALLDFLEHFFYTLNMNKMILQVAKFNKRAITCYEKCGFAITKEFYKLMDSQDIDLEYELSREEIYENFKTKKDRIHMGYYKMELPINEYTKRTNKNYKNVHNFVDMWKSFRKKTQYVDNNNIKNT